MTKLLNVIQYFFHPIPGSPFKFYVPLMVLVGLLVALGIAARYYIKKVGREDRAFKKLFSHIPSSCYWIATFLAANLFGRYERFPLLGARFVLFAIVFALAYIIGKAVYTYKNVYKKLPTTHTKETPAGRTYTTKKYSQH